MINVRKCTMSPLLLPLCLTLLASCGGRNAQTASAQSATLPVAAPGSTEIATAAAPTTPTTTQPAAVPSPFHIIAIGVSLFPTEGGLMLYNGEDLLADVKGDSITAHPEYLGTYVPEVMSNLEVLGGQWPEHGLISVTRPEARTSYSTVYEKNGKGWRKLTQTSAGEGYAGVQPWRGGRTIALIKGMFQPYDFAVISGPPDRLPDPALSPREEDGPPFSMSRVEPMSFAALTSGELFVLGVSAGNKPNWVVERWTPGAKKSVIEELPALVEASAYSESLSISAFAGNDVYVHGKVRNCAGPECKPTVGYLAHFDGKVWSVVPHPAEADFPSVERVEGHLWLVGGGKLYKQPPGSADWQIVPLPHADSVRSALVEFLPEMKERPTEPEATRVYADRNNVIWLDASAGSFNLVLRNRAIPAVWHAPGGSAWTHSVRQFQPYRAADEGCEAQAQIFVMLYAATKTTPKDYDYPLTRAALKGHKEFNGIVFAETEELGRHYFGAFVPKLSLARKLVQVVEKGVKGSKPVALCRDPTKVRILGIDLASGNVTSNVPAPPE